ncbi:MAG: hypothetical protein DMG65_04640 [Candidatus Angelobacter sp. Gp1-AA117]|nr:MAG: hypothetical protein DMG65_04640 [Candidatus Angelobacter sp. Gp1-AA117]
MVCPIIFVMDLIRLDQSTFRADLDEIDRWLEQKGFHQRDRLRVYRANIAEMAQREQASHPGKVFAQVQSEGRLSEILTSYAEGIDLVDALTSLRKKQVTIPDGLLKRVLDGPSDASLEDQKSNRGRNAMFELLMGAMAAKQDLQPIFGQENPDVEFQFLGRRVLMECKRVLSEKKILDKISEAVHQLEKCVHPDNGDIGLVAISISRLAHQGNGYWDAPTVEIGRAFLSRALRHMVDDLNKHLSKLSFSHAAGVVFHVSSPLHVQSLGYTVASEGLVYPMNLAESDCLRSLAEILRL